MASEKLYRNTFEIKMSTSQLRIDLILTMFPKIVRFVTLKKSLALGACAYSGWKNGLVRTVKKVQVVFYRCERTRPSQNGPFHLRYQPKIPEFWVEWKAPQRNTLILRFQKKSGSCMEVRLNSPQGTDFK